MSRVPVAFILLSAWLGAGVLFATVVAPAAFAVLPSRELAGALVGRVLPVIFISGIIVAVAGLLLDRSGAGRLPRVRRGALVAVELRNRREIAGPIEQLAPRDPRRVAFGQLHAISVGWLGLAMLGAATTVMLASMAPRPRRATLGDPLTSASR